MQEDSDIGCFVGPKRFQRPPRWGIDAKGEWQSTFEGYDSDIIWVFPKMVVPNNHGFS